LIFALNKHYYALINREFVIKLLKKYLQNRKKIPIFGALFWRIGIMNHRFLKTDSLGVLIGMMSLKEIVGVVPAHKIQGAMFYFAQISISARQGVLGVVKSLKRPVERNGISSCS